VEANAMSTSTYPVHVGARLDPNLSRWQWLVKWLLAIPHYIVLAFLWIAFTVLSLVAFFAILFTGRYPRAIFEFNVGVLRWSWRVGYYAYGALGTDRYPPFSLGEREDYPAHLEVDYPEQLSRGLVLVKWWLLAIPHYLVLGLFLGGAGYVVGGADGTEVDQWVWNSGLIGLLVLVAAVVLLFTGRYPQPVFDFVLGLNRWVLRVAAYAALMTDSYPPFRLDQGGDDPGTAVLSSTAAPPAGATAPQGQTPVPPPGAAPPSSHGAVPPPSASTPPAPPTYGGPQRRASRWTPGRVVSVVLGSLLLMGSLGLGVPGIALLVADNTMRDDAGFLMSGQETLSSDSYAIVSRNLEIQTDAPAAALPHRLLGDAKVTVDPPGDTPVFVGIAPTSDVARYLGGSRHATLVDLDGGPFSATPSYVTTGTGAPATPPTNEDFWAAQSSGTGTQSLVWSVDRGDWTVVVMNADASRGVDVDVAAGATVPVFGWVIGTMLVVAAVFLVAGVVLLVLSIRAASRRA
jgi:hypothetical protein